MTSRARNLANLLGGGEVTVPATKIADIPASKLSDEISTIEQVSSTDALSVTGNTVGDQRVVGNTLYIWNGVGWYRIALINETPTWDSGGQPAATYNLNTDSPAVPTIITLNATDPDGLPIQYSHITGGQMDSIATITQDSSVFTITPKTEAQAPNGGTGSVTFRASDGVNILPYVSSFTLAFTSWTNGVQQQKIQAGDRSTNFRFGCSVAISSDGNTAIAGSYGVNSYRGAAYVFTRSGTTWSEQQKLMANGGGSNDQFGRSVDISNDGNTAVITATQDDDTGIDAGSAHIFTRSGTTWSEQQKLLPSDGTAYDYMGISTAISGDGETVLIGSHFDDDDGGSSGSAYVFTRSGSTWSQQQKLVASDAGAGDEFGIEVAISNDGNTAIAGAPYHDTSGITNSGAAYIFTRSGSTWSQQQKIVASDPEMDDNFGISVSISGDGNTAIVGARYEDTNGSNAGAAYIYTRSGSTWSQQQKIQSDDIEAGDEFGISTALSGDGDTVIVGAKFEDTTADKAGSAYIFTRSGSTWSQIKKLHASDAEASDQFGEFVSISNDARTVIVGADREDTGFSNAGAAYIFVQG